MQACNNTIDICRMAICMASLKRSSLLILVMLLTFTLMVSDVKMVRGEMLRPSQCKAEKRFLVVACKQIVFGQSPSTACCAHLRAGHFECICPSMTPKLAALVDVNLAIKLLKICGKRVPRHFKCGSLDFP